MEFRVFCVQGVSNLRKQTIKNWGDMHFNNIPADKNETIMFNQFLIEHDFSPNTVRAMKQDIRKFALWFTSSNNEPFNVKRVTIRDVIDFRNYLQKDRKQAVATVNRCLVSLRRYFNWLLSFGHLESNPAKPVKELKRQALAPKGLTRSQVRKLLREIELRKDIRAEAVFSLMLYTGCRVGDVTNLELTDLIINERTGSVIFRQGKGNKQRTVPLPLPARRALKAYLDSRPPVESNIVFIGERGALTERGIRNLCDKYSAICGFKFHPHLLRHTMAHKFLEDNNNDLVSLAQILGHENLNTTRLYVNKSAFQLAEASERLSF